MSNRHKSKWMILAIAITGLLLASQLKREFAQPLLESLDPGPEKLPGEYTGSVGSRLRSVKAHRGRDLRSIQDEEQNLNPRAALPRGNQVEFRVEDGVAIAYGDQILGRIEEGSALQKGFYEIAKTQIWEKAEIPYYISPELPRPERVEKAIEYLRQNTRLQFVPFDSQYDAIVFEPGPKHCYSYLGRVGGLQPIKLSQECDLQGILHEIMHALGFIHEQSRPDRDQFVQILWDNIRPEFIHQFNLVPEALFEHEKDTPFDFQSVMLYRNNSFSLRPDLLTLQSKKVDRIEPISEGLSVGDLARIANLYRF